MQSTSRILITFALAVGAAAQSAEFKARLNVELDKWARVVASAKLAPE